jgi:hypothetical protein
MVKSRPAACEPLELARDRPARTGRLIPAGFDGQGCVALPVNVERRSLAGGHCSPRASTSLKRGVSRAAEGDQGEARRRTGWRQDSSARVWRQRSRRRHSWASEPRPGQTASRALPEDRQSRCGTNRKQETSISCDASGTPARRCVNRYRSGGQHRRCVPRTTTQKPRPPLTLGTGAMRRQSR